MPIVPVNNVMFEVAPGAEDEPYANKITEISHDIWQQHGVALDIGIDRRQRRVTIYGVDWEYYYESCRYPIIELTKTYVKFRDDVTDVTMYYQ